MADNSSADVASMFSSEFLIAMARFLTPSLSWPANAGHPVGVCLL
jgi:hypothetical protein